MFGTERINDEISPVYSTGGFRKTHQKRSRIPTLNGFTMTEQMVTIPEALGVARLSDVTGAAEFDRVFDHRDETMFRQRQELLFPDVVADAKVSDKASSTFIDNMSRPIHRWFRYSAGFSAKWIAEVIHEAETRDRLRVFDPFAGSATTLLAAEALGAESWGVEAHPFICRVARAKLQWRSDPDAYQRKIKELRDTADSLTPSHDGYPPLIYKCYERESLAELDVLRRAFEIIKDDSPASELVWLTLVAILRKTSCAGTAQWQYILPRKQKGPPSKSAPRTAIARA
jgi:hypothetical protein